VFISRPTAAVGAEIGSPREPQIWTWVFLLLGRLSLLRFFIRRFRLSQLGTDIGANPDATQTPGMKQSTVRGTQLSPCLTPT